MKKRKLINKMNESNIRKKTYREKYLKKKEAWIGVECNKKKKTEKNQILTDSLHLLISDRIFSSVL